MTAVPDLRVGATLEPTRQPDLHLALDPGTEERACGLARTTEQNLPAGDEAGELGVREDDDRVVCGDGELLPRDRFARVAEHLHVIEADVREQDDGGGDHVRRIVTSAEPRLDDRGVDVVRGELREGRSGQHLELRCADRDRRLAHARDRALEVGLLATAPDPLAPPAHVGREVRADVQARGGEMLLDRARRGRLAVRADDVDRGIPLVRVAERVEQHPHPPEAELLRPRVE